MSDSGLEGQKEMRACALDATETTRRESEARVDGRGQQSAMFKLAGPGCGGRAAAARWPDDAADLWLPAPEEDVNCLHIAVPARPAASGEDPDQEADGTEFLRLLVFGGWSSAAGSSSP